MNDVTGVWEEWSDDGLTNLTELQNRGWRTPGQGAHGSEAPPGWATILEWDAEGAGTSTARGPSAEWVSVASVNPNDPSASPWVVVHKDGDTLLAGGSANSHEEAKAKAEAALTTTVTPALSPKGDEARAKLLELLTRQDGRIAALEAELLSLREDAQQMVSTRGSSSLIRSSTSFARGSIFDFSQKNLDRQVREQRFGRGESEPLPEHINPRPWQRVRQEREGRSR